MTIEEAIERFRGLNIGRESFSEEYGEEIFCGDAEACELGVKALEKQMPKKPILSDKQNVRYAMQFTCPCCGKYFTGVGIADYCYHCGQALDWDNQSDGG